MRWSEPIPSTTWRTSAPTASQSAATALTKLTFVAKKAFARVLDRLRRSWVGHDERSADVGRNSARDLDRRRLVIGTDDDPVRVEEVVHSRAFTKELGVRDDGDVADGPAPVRRPWWSRQAPWTC